MAKTHPAAALSWAEGRRRRAWDLHLQGWSNKLIARALGVSPAAVSRWLARSHRESLASLAPRRRTGQGTRLTVEQQQHLLVLLKQGPEEQGFPGPFWTARRIAVLIARVFHVTYSSHHVSKLMHRVGWSYQKATVQARQRDEPMIEAWIHQTWPSIRRQAEQEGRTLVFIDEAAFYLSPLRRYTWSTLGESPVFRALLTHDHLSVISALTGDGRLYLLAHRESIKATQVIGFLRHLLRWIPGPMLILWDGGKIHKAREMQEFLQLDRKERLVFERCPACAVESSCSAAWWLMLGSS
jgi:transposase